MRLMEGVGVALQQGEPALLVGETGTGKTTLVQRLADQVCILRFLLRFARLLTPFSTDSAPSVCHAAASGTMAMQAHVACKDRLVVVTHDDYSVLPYSDQQHARHHCNAFVQS